MCKIRHSAALFMRAGREKKETSEIFINRVKFDKVMLIPCVSL